MKKRLLHSPVILQIIFSIIFSGCASSIPNIPAQGKVGGKTISTTLDSEIARYYLENYLQDDQTNQEQDERIDWLYKAYGDAFLDREDLKNISENFSPDFAALFWAEKLYESPKNKKAQSAFEEKLSQIKEARKSALQASILNADCCILLFVPGWDYIEAGHITGANMASPLRITRSLGIESHLLKINPQGSVEENAAFIANEISSYATMEKPVILAGPSSAGPAIHLALAGLLSPKQSAQVKAWINLGGILQGTPLLEHFRMWHRRWFFNLLIWYEGWRKESVLSMSMTNSRRRFQTLTLPEHVWVINYIGLSLSGDISRLAADHYAILRKYGPNDGLTLLPDSIAPGSQTIIALQSDHFFNEDPEIDLKTIALTQMVFEQIALSQLERP